MASAGTPRRPRVGDVVEGTVSRVGEAALLIQLPCGSCAQLPATSDLEFQPQLGDELVGLVVEDVGPQGEILLRLESCDSDEELNLTDPKGKGKGRGGYAAQNLSQADSQHRYTKHQLLALRPRLEAEGRGEGRGEGSAAALARLQPCPEEDLEQLLHHSILSAELPPAWWTRQTPKLKRGALQLALRTANMQAVYAMQPESLQFREALGALDLDPDFLSETLTLLWQDLAEKDIKPPAAEAVEWLLLRGAPASILLPEDPESLKIRMKGLQLLGTLGPSVCAASASAVAGCLRDPDVRGRRAAAVALGKLGLGVAGCAPRAIPRLLRLLKDNDPLCHAEAAKTLGLLGPEGLKAAAELLDTEEAFVQSGACLALGQGGAAAVAFAPKLLSLLQRTEGSVPVPDHLRASSIQALGRMGLAAGSWSMCSLLSELCTDDPQEIVRQAACVAMGLLAKEAQETLGNASDILEVLRPALATALDDPEPSVREAAAIALSNAA